MPMKIHLFGMTFSAMVIILTASNVALAQKDTSLSHLTELKKMVVVGSKTERAIENLPASITVTDKSDIEKNGATNIDEALAYEQGIYNKRSKGLMESMAGLTMRGFSGADQVLVLLDGQPLNNGYVGRVQFNNIAVEDIQKIEVARGPFSSLRWKCHGWCNQYDITYTGKAIAAIPRRIQPWKRHQSQSQSLYGLR